MKTILELREEAIKEDKNPEFYLYQKLEEIINELQRKDNNWNELKKWVKLQKNTTGIDISLEYEMLLDKMNKLEKGR